MNEKQLSQLVCVCNYIAIPPFKSSSKIDFDILLVACFCIFTPKIGPLLGGRSLACPRVSRRKKAFSSSILLFYLLTREAWACLPICDKILCKKRQLIDNPLWGNQIPYNLFGQDKLGPCHGEATSECWRKSRDFAQTRGEPSS